MRYKHIREKLKEVLQTEDSKEKDQKVKEALLLVNQEMRKNTDRSKKA